MSEITPNFFAVLPSNVRYSQIVDPEAKLLYAELTAHANELGICKISVKDLSALFDFELRTTQTWLCSLKEAGFINADLNSGGFQTTKEIRLNKEEV